MTSQLFCHRIDCFEPSALILEFVTWVVSGKKDTLKSRALKQNYFNIFAIYFETVIVTVKMISLKKRVIKCLIITPHQNNNSMSQITAIMK